VTELPLETEDGSFAGSAVAALAPLLDLADVRSALHDARSAVDEAFGDPALRRSGGQVAVEMSLRSAVASAALEGHRHEVDEVRAGTVTDPVVQGALRVAREAEGMASLWPKVPRQVLARVHVLAGRDVVADDTLGRPVNPEVVPRLSGVLSLVAGMSTVPTLLLASIVHGELLALRPFAGPSGVVARAAAASSRAVICRYTSAKPSNSAAGSPAACWVRAISSNSGTNRAALVAATTTLRVGSARPASARSASTSSSTPCCAAVRIAC